MIFFCIYQKYLNCKYWETVDTSSFNISIFWKKSVLKVFVGPFYVTRPPKTTFMLKVSHVFWFKEEVITRVAKQLYFCCQSTCLFLGQLCSTFFTRLLQNSRRALAIAIIEFTIAVTPCRPLGCLITCSGFDQTSTLIKRTFDSFTTSFSLKKLN